MSAPKPIDVLARCAKVSLPISDEDFPLPAIPGRGMPGSAKARVRLKLRTPDGIELLAEPAAKGLQKAAEAAALVPGGFWVVQGRLLPGGALAEAGVAYQPPREPGRAMAA